MLHAQEKSKVFGVETIRYIILELRLVCRQGERKHLHRMDKQRIDDQDVARFVERARYAADEGICEIHFDFVLSVYLVLLIAVGSISVQVTRETVMRWNKGGVCGAQRWSEVYLGFWL